MVTCGCWGVKLSVSRGLAHVVDRYGDERVHKVTTGWLGRSTSGLKFKGLQLAAARSTLHVESAGL